MYLDKPMRDHTLLQAIARVNRPYEEVGEIKKPAGFVVDFVGIFEKLLFRSLMAAYVPGWERAGGTKIARYQ